MPFRALLHLARIAILPALGSRDGELADLTAVLHRPDFRISAELADENELVDAACHDASFPNLLPSRMAYAIGRAPVLPHVTHAPRICRLLHEKKQIKN